MDIDNFLATQLKNCQKFIAHYWSQIEDDEILLGIREGRTGACEMGLHCDDLADITLVSFHDLAEGTTGSNRQVVRFVEVSISAQGSLAYPSVGESFYVCTHMNIGVPLRPYNNNEWICAPKPLGITKPCCQIAKHQNQKPDTQSTCTIPGMPIRW